MMKHKIAISFIGLLTATVFGLGKVNAQSNIQVVPVNWIDSIRTNSGDTLHVINFWATWCKPCVEELPYFEQLLDSVKQLPVKIYLVNTDMRRDLNTRVKDFIQKKGLRNQVVYINDINANNWIDRVNKEWSGAIPATWLVRSSSSYEYFYEGEVNFESLRKMIDAGLKPSN